MFRSSALPLHLLQRLVDRDRADRHRRVADDPLARLVDVVARRQVHHGVGAPARRPAQLVDLLADRRRHRRVADVRVDLHQEVAADDHRLGLRVLAIRRDDGAAAGDLVANEFGRHAFAQRAEPHLLGDLAAAGVVHLAEVDVAARDAAVDPRLPELRQPDVRIGGARPRRVIDVDRWLVGADADPPHRDANLTVRQVHTFGPRQLGQRLEAFDRIHNRGQRSLAVRGLRFLAVPAVTPSPTRPACIVHRASLSFAGITRIRFRGRACRSVAPLSLRIESPPSSPSYVELRLGGPTLASGPHNCKGASCARIN